MDIVVGKVYVRRKTYLSFHSKWTFLGQKVVVKRVCHGFVYFVKPWQHDPKKRLTTNCEIDDFYTYFRPDVPRMEENE